MQLAFFPPVAKNRSSLNPFSSFIYNMNIENLQNDKMSFTFTISCKKLLLLLVLLPYHAGCQVDTMQCMYHACKQRPYGVQKLLGKALHSLYSLRLLFYS